VAHVWIFRHGRLLTPEGTLSYTYYASGNVESITSNPSGVSVTYTDDDLNRLSTVVDGSLQGNQTTSYTYDNANNVATATYPNGFQTTFTYDQLSRMAAMSNSEQAGPVSLLEKF